MEIHTQLPSLISLENILGFLQWKGFHGNLMLEDNEFFIIVITKDLDVMLEKKSSLSCRSWGTNEDLVIKVSPWNLYLERNGRKLRWIYQFQVRGRGLSEASVAKLANMVHLSGYGEK